MVDKMAERWSFWQRIQALDRSAMNWPARVRRPGLSGFFIVVTYSGSGPAWFSAAALFIVILRLGYGSAPGLVALLGAMTGSLFSLVTGELLKRVVRRPRPYVTIPGHETTRVRPRGYSMPSTHTSTAVALVVGLLSAGHPLGWALLPWAVLVILSRFYLGVHYPSDLGAGFLLGVLFGLFNWNFVVQALVLPH